MSTTPEPKWGPKHAWARFSREEPPKRDADERTLDFQEIYALYAEEDVRKQASRCLLCPEPLCVSGCPLHNRIPEWISLAAEGRFLEAAALSRSTSNMPEICSRVCPQERLCESSCILNGPSEPVAIGAIEKFVNEYAFAHDARHAAMAWQNGCRVAVIGSGPAGVACADELARRGYAITVFEAQSVPGGLLVNGIPAYKLDKQLVGRRMELLRERGVEFKLGVTVGKDIPFSELRSRYDAVFLGIGAQKPKALDVPGADLEGVYHALPFLIQKNSTMPIDLPPIEVEGRRVAVLGGGDTAMDCLRTALRCKARETFCVYRRDFANMPGSRKEYANAVEEGAIFHFLTNPVEILANGTRHVSRLRCVRMELGAPDASGRRKPVKVRGSEFEMDADIVLAAYGFDPEPLSIDTDLGQIAVNEWGGVIVDDNQMTSVPGIFAGGDLVRGPYLVVHAVRDGRRAAAAIHRHLSEQESRKPPRPALDPARGSSAAGR
jgi:glutamate synthase (NADPH/NADH) small chain